MNFAKIKMPRWTCGGGGGVTRLDRVKDEYIRGSLDALNVVGKNEKERIETVWTCQEGR